MDSSPPTPDVSGRTDVATSRRARRRAQEVTGPRTVDVDVVVIGAGQAGLSAAYHLRRIGLVPVGADGWERAGGTFVVLDDAPRPGGAWQFRWPGLTMADAHAVHELPGKELVVPDVRQPAADAVPYYFAEYEEQFGLHVQRPVRVERVDREDAGTEPGAEVQEPGRLLVRTRSVLAPDVQVVWRTRGLVNASGTWQKPFWPVYPGITAFRGRQLHTRDYRSAQDLADGHVIVVGGGTSAVQLLLALARVTSTTWVTRRPPLWRDEEFSPELGRDAVAQVDARTRAGLPPESVVGVTGLPLTDAYRAGIERGVLRARPMFDRLVADGAEWDVAAVPVPVPAPVDGLRGVGAPGAAGDVAVPGQLPGSAPVPGSGWVDGPAYVEARTVLWCTGFRAALDHLAPLRLRGSGGGIAMDGTQVVADPRVQLVGYGPSASTIGANRAGREAVRNLRRLLSL